MIEVRTQQELEKAIKDHPDELIACVGNGYFTVSGSSSVEARGSSRVVAWGSSRVVARGSSRVEAWGSSRVVAWESSRVEAWGSSRVVARGSSRVVAWGSSRVEAWGSSRVEAWESSSVVAWGSSRVEAWGSSRVEARESSKTTAGKYVAVQRHGKTAKVSGGVLIQIPEIKTAREWCDFYGAKVVRGIATLYKAVDDDYATSNSRARGIFYKPGTKPVATDWDGGKVECGHGLHFCASPTAAKGFNTDATRFIACPVKLSEIVVHRNPSHPTKVKVPRVYGACVEVDLFGDPIKAAKRKAA